MSESELLAKGIADRYVNHISRSKKLSKLGEEVIEFTEAVLIKTKKEMKEEAGDICFLVLHILSKEMPDEEINLESLVLDAAHKMLMRNQG
jgi:NTP pyrophosphatase (non-canonical NTP hydrolase)